MKKYLFVFISLALGVGIALQSCTDENIPTSSSDATDLEAYSQSLVNPANLTGGFRLSCVNELLD